MHKFWSLGLEFQVSSLGLGFFDKVSVSSRIFNQVSVSKFLPGLGLSLEGYGLDYITDGRL